MLKSTNTAVSALARTGTNDIRDIKPPVEIPSGWAWALWVAGAIVLAAVGYLVWRYWRANHGKIILSPPVPAHIRAKQKLAEALNLIGQPKEFCIAVSDTLRWYLEERFNFHAPERTTEEFLHELRGTTLLTPDQKESLVDFLNRCDLVKFAKYEPREPELRDLHASAVRLVEETEPVLTAGGDRGSATSTAAAPAPLVAK